MQLMHLNLYNFVHWIFKFRLEKCIYNVGLSTWLSKILSREAFPHLHGRYYTCEEQKLCALYGLQSHDNLLSLHLDAPDITDDALKNFRYLPSLHSLHLAGPVKITDDGLSNLAFLTSLGERGIHCSANRITDLGLSYLQRWQIYEKLAYLTAPKRFLRMGFDSLSLPLPWEKCKYEEVTPWTSLCVVNCDHSEICNTWIWAVVRM